MDGNHTVIMPGPARKVVTLDGDIWYLAFEEVRQFYQRSRV